MSNPFPVRKSRALESPSTFLRVLRPGGSEGRRAPAGPTRSKIVIMVQNQHAAFAAIAAIPSSLWRGPS